METRTPVRAKLLAVRDMSRCRACALAVLTDVMYDNAVVRYHLHCTAFDCPNWLRTGQPERVIATVLPPKAETEDPE